MAEPEKLNPEPKAGDELNQEPTASIDRASGEGGGEGEGGELVGYLDVFVHQARDIHNICIYHKQDVYAKLSLSAADSPALSTGIVNGGGRNPVFNQSLRLPVRSSAAGSSLRCEIWMLSRVKNYLQDQLLGFALIPLADIFTAAAGKLAAEFSLSSSDLFHSPAGFVRLSLSYAGSSPEVIPISPPPPPPQSETDNSMPCEYEKVEFPDLNVAKENSIMVSEYFGIPCADLDPAAQPAESLLTAENGNCPDREAGVRVVESFSTENSVDSVSAFRNETPLSSVTTTDSALVPPSTPQSAESPGEKEKLREATEGQAESSSVGKSEEDSVVKPIISINIEPEETVVQQDIVDMYMKSMQQFTESLAKMKLPMDIENNSGANSENGESSSEKKVAPSKGTGPKVFYGSRAFF